MSNRALTETSHFKVGTQYRIRPKYSAAFEGKRVRITIEEAGTGYSGEKAIPHQPVDCEIKSGECQWAEMVVGFAGRQFDYRTGAHGATDPLEYQYRIEFLTTNQKKQVVPDLGATPVTGKLFRVQKPVLEHFNLWMTSLDTPIAAFLERAVLDVEGRFKGFEKTRWSDHGTREDFSFPVSLSLFVHYLEHSEHEESRKYEPVDFEVVMDVKGGELSGTLDLRALSAQSWEQLIAHQNQQLSLFAVLRFPTQLGCRAEKARKGEPPHPLVFADVVEYVASDRAHPDAGTVPMGSRRMMGKATGSGICSQLVNLTGQCRALGYEGGKLETEWKLWNPAFEAHQNDYNEIIQKWADEIDFDALTFKSMIAQESSFNPEACNAWGYAGLTQASRDVTVGDAKRSIGGTSYVGGKWVYDKKTDDRFKPEISIEIGAKCLQGKARDVDTMIRLNHYIVSTEERVKLIVSAYNIGQGVVQEACVALCDTTKAKTISWEAVSGASNSSSPLWRGIAKYPGVTGISFSIQDKYRENTEYVRAILERCR